MESKPTGREELHAFVDGELDRAATLKFASLVASSPELAREVAAYRGDKEALARTYGPIASQDVPSRLLAPFERHRARQRRRRVVMSLSAAASMAVILWAGMALFPGDPLVSEALAARRGDQRVIQDIAASSLPGADERDRIIAAALSVPVKVPDLAAFGYDLTSIALYRSAIQVSYRDRQNRLFTLYLRHSLGSDRFDLLHKGKNEICVWQNADMAVAMVGEMTVKDMLQLAAATYADLNL